jgi:hypothetical protein
MLPKFARWFLFAAVLAAANARAAETREPSRTCPCQGGRIASASDAGAHACWGKP